MVIIFIMKILFHWHKHNNNKTLVHLNFPWLLPCPLLSGEIDISSSTMMDSTEHDGWMLMPKDFKRLTINPEWHKLNQWQWHRGEAKFNVNKSSSFKENMFSEGTKISLHAVTNWQIFPLNLSWKETQPKKNWNCEWVNTGCFSIVLFTNVIHHCHIQFISSRSAALHYKSNSNHLQD